MTLLKKNIAANFVGNIWQALMNLAFIPLYIKFMGIESYGLIGFYVALQAVVVVLDMGLSVTLTREMARLSMHKGMNQKMRDLLRTLECIYFCVAIFICIVFMIFSQVFANNWINPGQLPPQTIENAVRLMGLAIAIQWPASLYTGGLIGLQSQVLLNGVTIGASTFRGAGAVLVLWLISPSILAFLYWQIIINILNTTGLAYFLWNRLPRTKKTASFKKHLLGEIWQFAAGVSGVSILATILTQLDKIILSKMLPLDVFGYYILASAVAMSLYSLIRPISSAVYPRLTQLVSLDDRKELGYLYHKSCQLISVFILPITVIIAFFSYELLVLWTQDPVTSEKSYILLRILICGTALNGLMAIPYALQLANGWTKLALYSNVVSIILIIPLIIFVTKQYDALGGASVWVLLNAGYVFISIHFMHKRFLKKEKLKWYFNDVFIPLLTAISVAGIGRFFICDQLSQLNTTFLLIIISVFTLGCTVFVTPTTRNWMFNKLNIRFP